MNLSVDFKFREFLVYAEGNLYREDDANTMELEPSIEVTNSEGQTVDWLKFDPKDRELLIQTTRDRLFSVFADENGLADRTTGRIRYE